MKQLWESVDSDRRLLLEWCTAEVLEAFMASKGVRIPASELGPMSFRERIEALLKAYKP